MVIVDVRYLCLGLHLTCWKGQLLLAGTRTFTPKHGAAATNAHPPERGRIGNVTGRAQSSALPPRTTPYFPTPALAFNTPGLGAVAL
jgi:hypothetical protein